jgi:hypothetical protein
MLTMATNELDSLERVLPYFERGSVLGQPENFKAQSLYITRKYGREVFSQYPELFIGALLRDYMLINYLNTASWEEGYWDDVVLNAVAYLAEQDYVFNGLHSDGYKFIPRILQFANVFNLKESTRNKLFEEAVEIDVANTMDPDELVTENYSTYSYLNYSYENVELLKSYIYKYEVPATFNNPNRMTPLYQSLNIIGGVTVKEFVKKAVYEKFSFSISDKKWSDNVYAEALALFKVIKDSTKEEDQEAMRSIKYLLQSGYPEDEQLKLDLHENGFRVASAPETFRDTWADTDGYNLLSYVGHVKQEDLIEYLTAMKNAKKSSSYFFHGLLSITGLDKLNEEVYYAFEKECKKYSTSIDVYSARLPENVHLYFEHKNLWECYSFEERADYVSRLDNYLERTMGSSTAELTLATSLALLEVTV